MQIDLFYVLLAISSVTFLLVLLLMIRFKLVEKYFLPLKFRIMNTYVLDPSQKRDYLKMSIYNSTLNDARVTSFGYVYRQKNVDYFREYLVQHNHPANHQALVAARDSLTFSLPLHSLVDVIQDINNGKFYVRKVIAYATTSFGQTTYIRTPLVRKHLQKALDKRAKTERLRLRGIAKENRRLRREKMAKEMARMNHAIRFWIQKTWKSIVPRSKKKKP
jgi:hypothetical protein